MKLTITDGARAKILEFRAAEKKEGLALRVAIRGRGPAGFDLPALGPHSCRGSGDAGAFAAPAIAARTGNYFFSSAWNLIMPG